MSYSTRLERFLGPSGLIAVISLVACASSSPHRMEFPESTSRGDRILDAGKVLVVLSAAPVQTLADGSTRETGYFLNEFYEPYRSLTDAGYTVVVATPGGERPALDPESLDEKYWDDAGALREARAFVKTDPQMLAPSDLEEVAPRADEFQAILVPGGQGVMVDLLENATLRELLGEFGSSDRPVGLVCHAPALLTRMAANENPFVGRQVTSVSGIEEWYIETFVMGADAQVRGIGDELDELGYEHSAAFPGRSNAVRDCNLVTSQNPFSGHEFNAYFLNAIEDWRRGGRCVVVDEG